MTQSWQKKLENQLLKKYGPEQGSALYQKYEKAFSAGYMEDNLPRVALQDIHYIEKLTEESSLGICFYRKDKDATLHLRLFQYQKPLALSDILPMLENFDLRTISESPHTITFNGTHIWISDFTVEYLHGELDVKLVEDTFEDAFQYIYEGAAENDAFNKLILGAPIPWYHVIILRAYAKYLRQIRFRFSQAYISTALVNNPALAKLFVELFVTMHDPKQKPKKTQIAVNAIVEKIERLLDQVTSLDEDKILRRILDVIRATIRTNYFQRTEKNRLKPYLSIKLNSADIPELPLPLPLYEIFVYSPDFEAIHLRKTKVARGGIRWSDRPEDFRTEVLGLMKAQVVKNAVIVPSGAKGGFVLKKVPLQASRETILTEVVRCYQFFIRGLLDITDNIVDKVIVHPPSVVCRDDDDPYLVVAADKGTATFSDIANNISKDYHFWLGDAFASGGSTGYDHKKIGITARGAWESIKRHFRELNIDVMTTNITVVGVGDMSGDVFGNGMLYTKHIKLLAAFDHRDIFIDPNPDPITSFNERERLFHLPASSWQDYNPNLISQGGGIFKRTSKSITITPEIKKILNIEDDELAPNDLIRAILTAPVDLLFNGGIGTYVKASYETTADVGDRTNDYCRVNGDDLRCRVVGEGGNLGFTQLGRIEYALGGGLINTDFIDNSGGVDCSDHEVNLKILLDKIVQQGRLTEDNRNELLASLEEEVAELVLKDNYYQALVMSFSAFDAVKNISLHANYLKELENAGIINRTVEFLPDDKKLLERKAQGQGLTRPELAILLAYTKIHIKNELLKTNMPEDRYLRKAIASAFPKSIRTNFPEAMDTHRLHRDIIATQLSNRVINEMGITFVYRLQTETGATASEIVRAHAIASHVFETRDLQKIVLGLDFKIPMSEQFDILFNVRRLINLATRWFLQSGHMDGDAETLINHYASRVKVLQNLIPQLMAGSTRDYLETLSNRFSKAGIPQDTARLIATYRAIYTTLNIIEVATRNKFDLEKTAEVYFAAGERINLVWFRDQIANDSREGHWNALARLTLRDELDISQRTLTVVIMNKNKNKKDLTSHNLIDLWANDNHRALERWENLLEMLHSSNAIEYSMFFIAIRELLGLITNSR